MDAPRFPLMRLPMACSQNVLRILKPIQLLGISLTSKISKVLVQSLKIKASGFIVYISNDEFFSVQLSFPRRVSFNQYFLDPQEISYRLYSNEMDSSTFIDHMKFIFNTVKIKVDFGSNIEKIDFEKILKGRQDVENICLVTDNQEEIRRILNFMKPSIVYMWNVTRPKDLLIQNFDYLLARRMIIRLEDLLISNVRNINAGCPMVPTKLFNRFLKLWMRSSNLQLESLTIDFTIDNKQEEMFDRLKITQNDEVRYFKSAEKVCKVSGGTNIVRFDGTKATICVYNRGAYFRFEMLVWHDHCIAKETDYNRCSSKI